MNRSPLQESMAGASGKFLRRIKAEKAQYVEKQSPLSTGDTAQLM